MENKKGISLIVLVITILVMIILAGIVVVNMSENNPIKKAQEANFKEDIRAFQEELGMHVSNTLAVDSTVNVSSVDAKTFDEVKKYISSFTKKYSDKIEIVDAKLVYTGTNAEEEKWAEELGLVVNVEVNAPVLSKGMLPVKFVNNSWVICDSKDPEWYSYATKRWANVMLSDGKYKEGAAVGTVVKDAELGSMFVWIPRFAYSVNRYKVEENGEGKEQQIHSITFLSGNTDKDANGRTYAKTYDASLVQIGSATPKIVHPAFSFGGVEKKGIWFAKFEPSTDGSILVNTCSSSCDVQKNNAIRVLPDKVTWRYISFGNAFLNCLNMASAGNVYGLANVDTHLAKNIEWGAATYLATSKYGFTPVINAAVAKEVGGTKDEDGYKTWAGGGENGAYKTNTKQSTTGNETGIYDLNGAGWEFVAGISDNQSSNLKTFANTLYDNQNILKAEYQKYFDRYEVTAEEKNRSLHDIIWTSPFDHATYGNKFRREITKAKFNLMKNKNGDAIYEDIKEGEYSFFGKLPTNDYTWITEDVPTDTKYGKSVYNSDIVLLGNIHVPYFTRGGDQSSMQKGGIFAINNLSGINHCFVTFRPVIINN